MEKSRSWPSAHDWKSCIPQKGIEGSNPSFSARKSRYSGEYRDFYINTYVRYLLTYKIYIIILGDK